MNRYLKIWKKHKHISVSKHSFIFVTLNHLISKIKWLAIVINIYLKYSAFQEKLTIKKNNRKETFFLATPEEYYKKNKLVMRLWTLISSTAEIVVLIICSMINRLDLFFYIVLIGFNVFASIVWLIQKNIDKSFKTTIAWK